jgi:hypothetical protein
MKRYLVAGVAVVAVAALQAQSSGGRVDWDKLRPEILQHYRSLVQLDTTSGA